MGAIAACCTTLSFLPQVLKILQTGDTRAISLPMYALFVTGVSCWLVYGFLRGDWPIIVANLITGLLSGTVLVLKVKALRPNLR